MNAKEFNVHEEIAKAQQRMEGEQTISRLIILPTCLDNRLSEVAAQFEVSPSVLIEVFTRTGLEQDKTANDGEMS